MNAGVGELERSWDADRFRRRKKFGVGAAGGSARYEVRGIPSVDDDEDEDVVRLGGRGIEIGEGGACCDRAINISERGSTTPV